MAGMMMPVLRMSAAMSLVVPVARAQRNGSGTSSVATLMVLVSMVA
jgi:hypothetical protein